MTLSTREKILIVALAISVISSAAIILSLIVRVHNVGRIKAVGVKFYWDAECTIETAEIDWGTLALGGTYGITVFCRNVRNTPVTLNLTTDNWNPPEAASYLLAGWNYTTGTVIQPSEVMPIQFQLSVSTSITGIEQFSFDFVVGVTEYVG